MAQIAKQDRLRGLPDFDQWLYRQPLPVICRPYGGVPVQPSQANLAIDIVPEPALYRPALFARSGRFVVAWLTRRR